MLRLRQRALGARERHSRRRDLRLELADVMVDTGSEYNWISEELLAELGVAPGASTDEANSAANKE